MAIGQVASLALLSVSLVYSLHEFFLQTNPADASPNYSGTHLSNPSGLRGSNMSYVSTSPGTGAAVRSGSTHFSSGYTPTIAPLIPGVNFPIEYVGEFWLVTFCVIVVHEFGHAAAASLERLQIQGCGTFFLFLFPGQCAADT
jgi:hypothetical protein